MDRAHLVQVGLRAEGGPALAGSAPWAKSPSVHEATLTTRSDRATTPLIQMGLSSKVTSAVKFKCASPAKDKVAPYLASGLGECTVGRFEVTATGDRPQQVLGLNVTEIAVTFPPRDVGAIGGPMTTTWDLTGQAT